MKKVSILGATGRMGTTLIRALELGDNAELCGALASWENTAVGDDAGIRAGIAANGIIVTTDVNEAIASADVAIDFTVPEAIESIIGACVAASCPLVTGTTGLEGQHYAMLDRAAKKIPVLEAPNMSIGLNVCLDLVRHAATILGRDYDVEVSEIHHRYKRDVPSGTALALGETLALALGLDPKGAAVFRQPGDSGPRSSDKIGFSSQRAGDVVGEHTVLFAGPGERVEITHRASDRMTFAQGALRAALWLSGQHAGRYGMADVLGLRDR